MRLMLTSFGIEQAVMGEAQPGAEPGSMFRRMPPVSFRRISGTFVPDYELLLLSDTILMDGASFGQLVQSPLGAYTQVADTLNALRAEGRIELVDFVSILRANSNLLDRMLEHDMKTLDQWVDPLRRSLNTWREFVQDSRDVMRGMAEEQYDRKDSPDGHDDISWQRNMHAHAMHGTIADVFAHEMHHAMSEAHSISFLIEDALSSSEKRKRKEYRDPLREVLRSYLAYVNANLVLSNELNVAFHDWLDFTPFYALKFLSVGKDRDGAHEGRDQLERLFTVSFPDLAIRDTRSLVRALNDKRIEDLRKLVDDALAGKVTFDEEFAKAVLTEVLQCEKKARKVRNVLGYASMPVGFLPWIGTPAQKLIEEAIGTPLEHKIKAKNKWFYMLSEIADSMGPEKSGGD